MSTKSELKARLGHLVQIRDIRPARLSSAELVLIRLRRVGPLDRPVTVFQRLVDAGTPARAAHAALNDLAATAMARCDVYGDEDFGQLASDLCVGNVLLLKRRPVTEPAAFIAEIRARHGLAQREFADRLGLDVRTLQNWEQGRNRPDGAVLTLIMLFDRHPDLVEQATFEGVAAAP